MNKIQDISTRSKYGFPICMTKAAMPLGNVCKCSLKMLNGRNIHKLLRQSIVNLCHSEQGLIEQIVSTDALRVVTIDLLSVPYTVMLSPWQQLCDSYVTISQNTFMDKSKDADLAA